MFRTAPHPPALLSTNYIISRTSVGSAEGETNVLRDDRLTNFCLVCSAPRIGISIRAATLEASQSSRVGDMNLSPNEEMRRHQKHPIFPIIFPTLPRRDRDCGWLLFFTESMRLKCAAESELPARVEDAPPSLPLNAQGTNLILWVCVFLFLFGTIGTRTFRCCVLLFDRKMIH